MLYRCLKQTCKIKRLIRHHHDTLTCHISSRPGNQSMLDNSMLICRKLNTWPTLAQSDRLGKGHLDGLGNTTKFTRRSGSVFMVECMCWDLLRLDIGRWQMMKVMELCFSKNYLIRFGKVLTFHLILNRRKVKKIMWSKMVWKCSQRTRKYLWW